MVVLSTTHGDITIDLHEKEAPITTGNFLRYVDEGFFTDTVFHRVIPGFMIQGGGLTEKLAPKETHEPIKNEADNGLKNTRGAVAMARTSQPNSATAQFFINVADNDFLDHGERDFGYAVFGRVVNGMDVVDKIVGVKTASRGGHDDVPMEPVKITGARRA
jgi:cyclophilin family peptidyl-prolyl cis-trans isomerase